MKRGLFIVLALIFSVVLHAEAQKFAVGDKAVHTDVKMTDVTGAKYSIDDVKGENGVLLVFSCNSCPFVIKWEDRYNELKKYADQNKVGFIVLNSNCANRGTTESMEEMKKHAKEKGYQFPYVIDGGSKLANALVAQTTPHAFLFDKEMKLVYKGVIDDNHEDASAVKKAYVKDAIKSIASGKEVAVSETKPMGCGIKRAQASL